MTFSLLTLTLRQSRERRAEGGRWDNIRTHLTLTDLRPRTARWLEGHAHKETH